MDKRYFKIEDRDGATYYVVDENEESARDRLRDSGVEFGQYSLSFYAAMERGMLKTTELTAQRASEIRCDTADDDRGRGRIALSECDLGEWFSTEY